MAWSPDFQRPPGQAPARCDNPLALCRSDLAAWRRFRLRMFMGAEDMWRALNRKPDPCCEFYREFKKMIEHQTLMLGAYMSYEEFARRHPGGALALFTLEKVSAPDTKDRDGLRRL